MLSFDPSILKTAVILTDRPEVGADANPADAKLPRVVLLRATAVDLGAVRCAVESSVVTTLAGRKAPTWGDLEAVWQMVASAIECKIRSAEFEPPARHRDRVPVVRIAPGDVTHETQLVAGPVPLDGPAHMEGKRHA
jgi:hypothetical protein